MARFYFARNTRLKTLPISEAKAFRPARSWLRGCAPLTEACSAIYRRGQNRPA